VIVILRGSGRAITEGKDRGFGPNSTLVFAAEVVHQVVNSSSEEMLLLAAFSKASPGVFTPEGERMALPWQAEMAEV
jgi:quercetin dioxygenase-like cupin family protein